MNNQVVLSIFPGIDLFGRAFVAEGFYVVRGPDVIWGEDIRDFHPPCAAFDGFIGGPPCQDFSRIRRTLPTGYGKEMLDEFVRVVTEGEPEWFILENVPGVPRIAVEGYAMQVIHLDARDCGMSQRRRRLFQWGSRRGDQLQIKETTPRPGDAAACCLATEGTRANRRTFEEFCKLQGLPGALELPGMSRRQKYRLVGNGVPIPMGRTIARAVLDRMCNDYVTLCACGCGREVLGRATHHGPACRKRMQRARDSAADP